MDKNFIGRWHSDGVVDTLNIFDGEPLRAKISISSSGYYNTKPNCIYEKDEALCFELNGEEHRMVFTLAYSDGKLKGHYTYFGSVTDIEYERVSSTPEDGKYKCRPIEQYLPNSDRTRLEVLREYAEYEGTDKCTKKSSYALGGEVPDILEKYGYSEYVGGYVGDALVFRLLDFVCDSFRHNGTKGLGKGRGIRDLILFCEGNGMATNCRGLSLILASLLRFNGIKARHVTCMPYEKAFYDCHVVVDCELPSGKRIMLDPTWRLYLTGTNGEYLSLPDMRRIFIDGDKIVINPEAGYNGTPISEEEKKYYRNYMTKNTFRFFRGTHFSDGVDENSLQLIPKGYPTEGFSKEDVQKLVYDERAFWEM